MSEKLQKMADSMPPREFMVLFQKELPLADRQKIEKKISKLPGVLKVSPDPAKRYTRLDVKVKFRDFISLSSKIRKMPGVLDVEENEKLQLL